MSQGIGIRYTGAGIRIVGLERQDGSVQVTTIAAGIPIEAINDFLDGNGLSSPGTKIACGLCPGDFLNASFSADDTMSAEEIRDQLRWEIERKMITDTSDYSIDFAIADLGFVFAGLKTRIKTVSDTFPQAVTDVEPVALYNGCDAAGEIGNGIVMLSSLEAEGVSSVLLNNGELIAIESCPVKEEELAPVLGAVDKASIGAITGAVTERLAGHIADSYGRVTKRGKRDIKPSSIILAGSGATINGLTALVSKKTGIETTVSNPFSKIADDIQARFPDVSGVEAAFTTCYGLAMRALEE